MGFDEVNQAQRRMVMRTHALYNPANTVVKAAKLYSDYKSKIKQSDANKKLTKDYRSQNPSVVDWKVSSEFDDSRSVLLKYDWRESEPTIMVRAMTLAGDKLLAAGPADTWDETSLYGQFYAAENQPKLNEQESAFNGERSGHLWFLDARTGKHLA